MPTPYSPDNQRFSDAAHLAAQTVIYPELFQVIREQLAFVATHLQDGAKERILDGEMAVDRIVSVRVTWLQAEIEFTVQERFRRVEYLKYQDLTITEWNHRTNQKSELFKLNAGIFLYGYFNEAMQTFPDWIAINTTALLYRLTIKKPVIITPQEAMKGQMGIVRGRNTRSDQTFLTFRFDHLLKSGVVLRRKQP